MNGRFVEDISPHEIIIKVVPGADSRIVIADANGDQIAYRSGSISINGNGLINLFNSHNTYANLDTGQGRQCPGRPSEFTGGSGDVTTANGTQAALWLGGAPTLNARDFRRFGLSEV